MPPIQGEKGLIRIGLSRGRDAALCSTPEFLWVTPESHTLGSSMVTKYIPPWGTKNRRSVVEILDRLRLSVYPPPCR